MRKITFVMSMALMVATMTGFFVLAEETEDATPMAPITRYVGGGNSTYTTIQDAIDDADSGDMIVIYDGIYQEDQLKITKSDLVIIGNMTSTGVKVTSSVTGPDLYIDMATNVTISQINFTHNDQAARIVDSDNITFTACVFWSTGGTGGAIGVEDSQYIIISGDFMTFTMARVHAEGDNNPALKIQDSSMIVTYISELDTNGDNSDVIACYGSCPMVGASFAMIGAWGTSSSIMYSNSYINGLLAGVVINKYTDKMVEISSGYVETIDIDVPDSDVSVGSDGTVKVVYERIIVIIDEDGNYVEDVHVKVSNEYDGVIYETSKWGGSDPTTDSWGETDYIPFMTKVFEGSATPNYGENNLLVFYDGGDVIIGSNHFAVDANSTDDLEIQLLDFMVPEEATNVMAETISHEQIDLSFEASPAADIDHYEVWVDSGAGFEWDFNTTDAGTFPYMALIPDTTYSFKVVSVDDDELNSTGVVVSNTTMPPVNGTIHGQVIYSGGPMDGMPAAGAVVKVLNMTMEMLIQTTTNSTGHYVLEEVLFGTGYTLHVTPVDVVVDMGLESGYIAWEWEFDHTDVLEKDISLSYYEYNSDDIHGQVTYNGGPMDGDNATDATVTLYNETMVEIATTTTNSTTGMYLFEDIEFGVNYTMKVVPVDSVEMDGTETGYISWEGVFDHDGSIEWNIALEHYEYVSDNIHGQVTYHGGDMDGMNATNATVILYNETMVEIATTTTNSTTGMYLFEDIEFGVNYTLKVIPEVVVVDGGEVSGYIEFISDPFNHTGVKEMDMEIGYYTYVPPAPTSGTISGQVTYKDGTVDGDASEGAKVSLMDEDGAYTNTTTNATGHYLFEDVVFGSYAITVYPPDSMMGETDVKSGYMMAEVAEFVVDSDVERDVELPYYEYVEPTVDHPKVKITDKDGEPVEGVTITVTIGDETYTATTDANGEAVFDDFDGAQFPTDAEFKAEKNGYDTIEWKQGESVPVMNEKEGDSDSTLMYILLAAVVVILLIVLFLFMRKKEDDSEYEE